MSSQKTVKDREQLVVKANDLIRKTRYSLTAQQQKIVLYAISKIKPNDDINTEYTFDINELAEACGMRIRDGGSYYERIKDDLLELTTRQWCKMPNGDEMTISWIGDTKISERSATVTVSFNRNLQPYLFELSTRYTKYRLQNVLVFRGKYAIRLYEILRSYTTEDAIERKKENEIDISLDDLKYQLDIQNYDLWTDFNRFVLAPAVKEINKLAEDIHVEYYPMKGEGTKAIKKINFVITSAGIRQQTEAYMARKKKLDHVK